MLKQWVKARKPAEQYGRDLGDSLEERVEVLLEAAGRCKCAGETERVLQIYDELVATASGEDAQFAAAERLDVLAELGRFEEIDAELERLGRDRVRPGPASLIAEFLEAQERPSDALTWFNIACRDIDADAEVDESTLFVGPELQGRARVRRALGLAADELDERTAQAHSDLVRTIDDFTRHTRRTNRPPRPAATYFVRADVERALAAGLVHMDNAEDLEVDSYFRVTENAWRNLVEQGYPRLELVPTRIDDYLTYTAEHGLDPKDQQARLDYVQQSAREAAATISWPPPRNAPCWCDSGRKYKKCCGAVC